MSPEKKSLAEITVECFGPLASKLLEVGAVHPIRGRDGKTPGYQGWNEPFFDVGTTDFLALGLKAGELSGITVWDFDDKLISIPQITPNVQTRRGFHVYTAWAGERRHIGVGEHIDVLGGGNAVFYGPGRSFHHADLADAEALRSLRQVRAGVSKLESVGQVNGTGTRLPLFRGEEVTSTCEESDYSRDVRAHGLRLDVALITKGAQIAVSGAPVGKRNDRLFRQAVELVRCGIDPFVLEMDAIGSGLKPEEVTKVLERARTAFRTDRSRSVLSIATAWSDAIKPRIRRAWHELIDEIVRHAVAQNSLAPMITHSDVITTRTRSATSRRLTALHDRGFLHKRPMGWKSPTERRSNVYELCRRHVESAASLCCARSTPRACAPDAWPTVDWARSNTTRTS